VSKSKYLENTLSVWPNQYGDVGTILNV